MTLLNLVTSKVCNGPARPEPASPAASEGYLTPAMPCIRFSPCPSELELRGERLEHRRQRDPHRPDAAGALVSGAPGLVELFAAFLGFQEPAEQFADMAQARFKIMHIHIEDRTEEARIRHHAGALPEAAHHHTRPLEIADPVAVQVQHN